jgi:ATP-dependent exoDNAse (exonuclease V) alpha subunit
MSGRGADLVVGVAGSGKSTMLAVVTDAFESAGCQVVGTSTSGQAARNLVDTAEIAESRTIASLMWRLDHNRLRLDSRAVLILDEAGMTDDPDFLEMALRVERSDAKMVIVGDNRQLGSVGPGGAMGALLARHPEAVHLLADNHRQVDIEERSVLEHLRAGSVAAAVDWYARHGRITTSLDRDEALDRAIEGWAACIEAGRDVGLYAHRRANVARLNEVAKAWMTETGRRFGPAIDGFAVGDRVVATTPIPGVMVTSDKGTVMAVQERHGMVDVWCDDGRIVRLQGADLDQVELGYATTVHRAQGATVDTAHVFADGGGRELGYVEMSRARGRTQVYCIADDSA